MIATSTIVLATLMHGVRLSYRIWIQNLVVGLKVALIIAFILYGTSRLPAPITSDLAAFSRSSFDLGAFAASLVWISFAYSGWNATVYVAGEVRQPEYNLHRSLLLGTYLVIVMYMGLNFVFVYADG